MGDVLLPPLILELRARAGEAIAGVKELGDETEKVAAKADASQSRVSSAFGKLAGVGKVALAGIAGGAAAVGVESVKMAADFQKDTNVLVTAAGESASGLKVVRAGIQSIAMDTGTTWQNLTEGMYQVEKAGYHGADGLQVLRAAAEGAAEEGASMASVTNAMTSVMASYHLHASDSVRVMNALKTAAGEGKMTMEQFSASISTSLPVASAAGISFPELAGAIATLTQHGTSAAEANQELANTIRNLSAPNHVAMTAMQQLGLSSTDLSSKLGQRGLTGTIQTIVEAIGSHMGKSGMVMVDAFKKSQAASSDLQTELANMPPQLKSLSQSFLDGKESYGAYNTAIKGMGASSYELGKSFVATVGQARGFNSMLKSGSPAAQTFAGTLKQVMGGATGMNTALMLSGENMAGLQDRVKKTAKSYNDADTSVEGWKSTQNLFSIQMARFRQMIDVLFIRIGSFLIPILQSAASWFMHHIGIVETLAGIIGGALVVSIVAYVGRMVWAAAQSVASFAKMLASGLKWAATNAKNFASAIIDYARYTAAGDTWLATQLSQLAESAAAGWAWVTEHAAMAAGYIAENVAMAASATAAFIAENAATLGLAAVIAAVVAAVVWLATHWSTAWNAIKTAALDVWHALQSAWSAVWNVIGPVLTTVFNTVIKPVFELIATEWKITWAVLRTAFDALKAAWNAVWDGVKAVWDDVISPVFDFIKEHWGLVFAVVTGGLSFLIQHWHDVWGAVEAVYNNVIEPVFAFIARCFNDIVQAGEKAYSFLVTKVLDPIVAGFKDLWTGISTFVDDIVSVGESIGDGFMWAWDHTIGPVITWIKDGINDVKSAWDWVTSAGGQDGVSVGKNFAQVVTGSAAHHAAGGIVRDGLFMFGEHGPEIGVKRGSQLRMLSNAATSGVMSSGGALAGDSGGGSSGTVEVHSHLYLDGQQIYEGVERAALQTGARRGSTWTPFNRGGSAVGANL